jgi:AcrR family transcriptional regulator
MSNPRVVRSRQTLVEATLSLLDDRAGHLPSVTQVCEQAGVSRPTFYQHFGDLSTLVAEAVAQRLNMVFTAVVPHPGEQTGASTVDVIRALLELVMKDRDFYRGVLEGPAAFAVQRHMVAYFAERLMTVSPFAVQLREAASQRVEFLAAGTTHLVVHHLFDTNPAASIEVTAARVADTLTISAAALSSRPSPEEGLSRTSGN